MPLGYIKNSGGYRIQLGWKGLSKSPKDKCFRIDSGGVWWGFFSYFAGLKRNLVSRL